MTKLKDRDRPRPRPRHETLTLQYPDLETGEQVEQIALRRPCARDLKAAIQQAGRNASPLEIDIILFSHLSERSPETIAALDLVDFQALQELYAGFLSRAD